MPKFIFICTYSPGSWARLMRISDDRVKAVRVLAEALGGSVDMCGWEVSARAAYVVGDLPDSESAAAAAAAISGTGAFRSVENHELLTPEHFSDMLHLADDAAQVYQVPGQGVIHDDYSSEARFSDGS
jgi:uncharacterized protein with GYD domain